MPPRALTWLRSHWRPVAVLTAVLVAFGAGWAAHRPQPQITYRDRQVVTAASAEHHQEQLATAEQQTSASTATEQLHATRQVSVHRLEHVLPSGERTVETTRTEGDELEVAEAQQVVVQVTFGQVLHLDSTSSSSTTATRETSLVQTPAPDRPIEIDLLGGVGASGPVYGARAAWSPGELPLVDLPVWLGVQVQAGPTSGPMVLASIGLQL